MKIAILGTRGIPNNYGGFEQCAEYLSVGLVEKGHEVTVYSPSFHPYKEESYKRVEIIRKASPKRLLGESASSFIYDYFCFKDAVKQDFDIILELGLITSSLSIILCRHRGKVIATNLDGLEWKRSKYGTVVKYFLKVAEKWAVKQSDVLISDSKGIQDYLKTKYNVNSHFIAYGAEKITAFNEKTLAKYSLTKKKYNLIIARLEPENNIEPVLKAHEATETDELIIIGNVTTKHGKYLANTYKKNIRFLGGIYDLTTLNDLRYFSNLYFHGHSVGGTNPSLLEAMGCSCAIIANENEFNKSVLGNNAYYFSNYKDIINILKNEQNTEVISQMKLTNLTKIETVYNFEKIHHQLVGLLKK